MELEFKGDKPDWIKKVIRNEKARKRYFMKKYGSLDRMYEIDGKFEAKMDEVSMNMEYEAQYESEHEFDNIKESWDSETCYPDLANKWSKANPSLGQCAVTALLVQDLIGGEIYCDKSKHHYYNYEPIYRGLIDLTEDQFDTPVNHDYTFQTSREYLLHSEGAKKAKTLERYELLKERYIRAGGWGEIT